MIYWCTLFQGSADSNYSQPSSDLSLDEEKETLRREKERQALNQLDKARVSVISVSPRFPPWDLSYFHLSAAKFLHTPSKMTVDITSICSRHSFSEKWLMMIITAYLCFIIFILFFLFTSRILWVEYMMRGSGIRSKDSRQCRCWSSYNGRVNKLICIRNGKRVIGYGYKPGYTVHRVEVHACERATREESLRARSLYIEWDVIQGRNCEKWRDRTHQ